MILAYNGSPLRRSANRKKNRRINNIVQLLNQRCPQPNLLSSLASRLGLYNDGMLGSANDTGTYGDKAAADLDTNYSDAWTREDELAFQNDLCLYVPNGGEVIIDNVYNDFDNAVKDLSQMHVSYLNSEYDSTVLNKWKEKQKDQ